MCARQQFLCLAELLGFRNCKQMKIKSILWLSILSYIIALNWSMCGRCTLTRPISKFIVHLYEVYTVYQYLNSKGPTQLQYWSHTNINLLIRTLLFKSPYDAAVCFQTALTRRSVERVRADNSQGSAKAESTSSCSAPAKLLSSTACFFYLYWASFLSGQGRVIAKATYTKLWFSFLQRSLALA